jgi:hypothetical protein
MKEIYTFELKVPMVEYVIENKVVMIQSVFFSSCENEENEILVPSFLNE